MPQASAKNGTPPREHTVSTISRVPFFWHSSPIPSRFWYTPVLLSPCRATSHQSTVRSAFANLMMPWWAVEAIQIGSRWCSIWKCIVCCFSNFICVQVCLSKQHKMAAVSCNEEVAAHCMWLSCVRFWCCSNQMHWVSH